jgi:hypothetical protein
VIGHGNGGRYRYYVCGAESLPADELEQAILDQFANLLGREDDIRTYFKLPVVRPPDGLVPRQESNLCTR